MPTNGVIEWVFPVLDSIYSQGVDESEYEVVIVDNGRNYEFKQLIKEYISKHNNIVYVEDLDSPLFLNEPIAYKNAHGEFIKFVNHRTKLIDGTLKALLDFVESNKEEKPIVYYGNGVIDNLIGINEYNTFDDFVKNLSYWSSWSTGMGIWKNDLKEVENSNFNELFPHTTILFSQRNRNKYIINNNVIFDEIPQGNKPKGNYDLFYAFGVEYPSIILGLYRDDSISFETFKYVLDKNGDFIADLCVIYFVLKVYCSYDLSGYRNMLGIFYRSREIKAKEIKIIVGKLLNKLKTTRLK